MLRIRLSKHRRAVLSWALCDWANSAFATVVIAGVFPILCRDDWAASLPDGKITVSHEGFFAAASMRAEAALLASGGHSKHPAYPQPLSRSCSDAPLGGHSKHSATPQPPRSPC